MSWANWNGENRSGLKFALFKGQIAVVATPSAYRPRLVAHVVNGGEGVDARDAGVLQPDDQVPEILVLGHAEGVLADEHKVWLEGPGG